MKRSLLAVLTGAALTASISAVGAPYEDYKMQIQRQAEAKRQASAPDTGTAHEDNAAMGQRMLLIREMDAQLRQAKTVDTMTPEQMREWIVKHTELMGRMHQELMNDHPPMGSGGGSMQHQSR